MSVSDIFICVEDCSTQYSPSCNEYFFKKGQEYQYDYNKHSKFVLPIYLNDEYSEYNGSVNNKFIDKYFVSKEESDIIAEVDRWFGELLESPVRLKRIKKKDENSNK